MDAQQALRTIRTFARIALDTDNDELSTEALADMLRRTLQGVVVVPEKVLGKQYCIQNADRLRPGSDLFKSELSSKERQPFAGSFTIV